MVSKLLIFIMNFFILAKNLLFQIPMQSIWRFLVCSFDIWKELKHKIIHIHNNVL